LRERFNRFMQGRYGADNLNWFLLIVAVILMLLASFITSNFIVTIFTLVAYAALIFAIYRIFSKNRAKRAQENAAYMQRYNQVKGWFKGQRRIADQRKDYRIYNCPSCNQKIRVPKGKGKIEIRCPKCGTTFVKKS